MSQRSLSLFLSLIVSLTILLPPASAYTDFLDVQALQDLYIAFSSPSQLKGWKSNDGDPCEESWTGVACSGSSVIHIDLQGLGLTGKIDFQLFNLKNLKQLDLSNNNLQGEIPYNLPLNLTRLNLACNNFTETIPYSLTLMKNLRHLNLSHNLLRGPVGNVFTGLQNLREMDLSSNNFTGDLPSSFSCLTNLTRLFLQSNQFTGSVTFLAGLPLSDLNIQNNHFSGVIPKQFEFIRNLWLGGNRFKPGANDPPWNFPLENLPRIISSPPKTESSAFESYPFHKTGNKKRGLGFGGIAFVVGGITLALTCAALAIAITIRRSKAPKLINFRNSLRPQLSLPVTTARDNSAATPETSPQNPISNSPYRITPRPMPPIRMKNARFSRRSFSKKCRIPVSAKLYTVAELQSATSCFSEENLLGEGSLGTVYRAEFPNGQILAVKNINTVAMSLDEDDQFLDVIWNAARLRHPNIVTLLGYCVEHGHHLLVYEYVRNLSLGDALHGDAYMPLSWGLRLRIAIGIARALDYLHSTCMPPFTHGNLKAANILLDEDLMPRICDCGLAVLRALTSNSVKLKASEMAIRDTGYVAAEHVQPGIRNTKGDIYAFGVLLVELLTGRRPFDSTKPREEQSLVKWASARLHDSESLEEMVDPTIKRTIPSRALSQFADIVSLCIQPDKEFRPPISEVVESLLRLVQKHGVSNDAGEIESRGKSFRSTNASFFGSPTVSYLSI